MIFNRLIRLRKYPIIGWFAFYILKIIGLELPRNVKVGKRVRFMRWAVGTVVHRRVEIEDDVRVFQNVTLGRADVYRSLEDSKMEGILVKKGAIIGAGAKVLCKEGTLIVGENTVIGANAVLFESTGDNEIWVGNPARKIGMRKEFRD